jgi:hypothetical protein
LTGYRFFHQAGPVIGVRDEFFDLANFGSGQPAAGFHKNSSPWFDSLSSGPGRVPRGILNLTNNLLQGRHATFDFRTGLRDYARGLAVADPGELPADKSQDESDEDEYADGQPDQTRQRGRCRWGGFSCLLSEVEVLRFTRHFVTASLSAFANDSPLRYSTADRRNGKGGHLLSIIMLAGAAGNMVHS